MIRFIIFSIFLIYFQYFFSTGLGILGTNPNFLLPAVIYVSATKSKVIGLVIAFVFGVILDINAPHTFGISTLLFVLLGFIFGEIQAKINREQKLFLLFLVLLANLFYFLLSNFLFSIFQTGQAIPIIRIFLLILYNSFYSAIIIILMFLIDNLQISVKSSR